MRKITLAAAVLLCLLLFPTAVRADTPSAPLKEVRVAGLWPHKAFWPGQQATFLRTKLYATASYLLLFRQPGQDMPGAEQLFYGRTLIGKTYTINGLFELKRKGAGSHYFWQLTRPGEEPVWVRDTINTPLDNLPFATPEDTAAEHKQIAGLENLAGTTVWINRNIAAPPQLSADLGHLTPLTVTGFKSAGPFSEAYTLFLDRADGEPLTWTVGITGERTAYSNRQFYKFLTRAFYLQDPATLYPKWPAGVWPHVKNREVRVGWDKPMVLMSWDHPDKLERIVLGPDKGLERWSYSGKHLFFKDATLVKIKVPKPPQAKGEPSLARKPSPKPGGKDADKSDADDGLLEVSEAVKTEKKVESKKEAD